MPAFKRRLPWILSCLLVACAVLTSDAAKAQDWAPKVEEYMQAQMKVRHFSGTVLIAKEGQPLLRKGYGLANMEWNIPNAPDTKFRLGSITKQFTSMAIMMLEERGKLSVQDPLCKHISPCPDAWAPVTIHHLLTHTSGIPSYTGMPSYAEGMALPVSHEQMVARFRDKPLEFVPGTKWNYDNSGYYLLGMIVEKVSGVSYEKFLQENIFAVVGMKDTGYDRSETLLPHRAAGYSREGEGWANSKFLDMGQPYAAGSLYSTVDDLSKWDQALYTEKLVKRATLDRIFTPVLRNYAYGWGIDTRWTHKTISHGGGINGFSTDIARYPDDKMCVIVLSNFESANSSSIGRDLAAIVYGQKVELPVEHVQVKVDAKIYANYVGQYELAPTFVLTITTEGEKIYSQATNQSKIEIFPESETSFFLRVVEATLTFEKGPDGKVTGLVLHQNGRHTPGKRLP